VTFEGKIERDRAAALLGLGVADVREDLEPQIAGAGSPFLYIPLNDTTAVDRAVLDAGELQKCEGLEAIVGVYLFAQTDEGAYARMFAPMSGIPEDPATGGATGPLYAYLKRHGKLPDRNRFVNRQGVALGRPSLLQVRMTWDGDDLRRIEVGGQAVFVGEGHLNIP